MHRPLPASTPTITAASETPKRGGWRVGGGMLIGVIVSASFLIIVLHDIDWHLLGASLRHARALPVIVATFGFIGAYALIALRWQVLLGNDRLRFLELFEVLNVGLVCNVILPARGGDMVRLVVLNQRARIRMSAGLASVMLEKLLDVAALVLLLIPALIWVALPRWVVLSLSLAIAGVLIGFAVCIALARSSRDLSSLPLIRNLPARLRARLDSIFAAFREGVRMLFLPGRVAKVSALSLAIWVLNSVAAYFVIMGLRIEHVSLGATFVVIAIMNLGLIIPSSPGYVGTYEFLGVSALALFHVAHEPALEYALVLHTLTLLIVVVLGAVSMARLGYSLRTVARRTAVTDVPL